MPLAEGYSVAWRPPFHEGGIYRDVRGHGQTVAEIVASIPDLHPLFETRGVVCINGEPVPREMWAHLRPKAGGAHSPVSVTLHLPLAGGGGKSIIGLIAAVAIIAITQGIASGAILGSITGATAAGGATLASSALAGAVGLVGALAISALTAPPTRSTSTPDTSTSAQKSEASISGNLLKAGGEIPRVVGTHKIYPPFAAEPLVTLDGDDEYVEAVFALAGPHLLSDIRINDAPIDDQSNIEYEAREGWPDDPAVTLVARQARTLTPNVELSVVDVDPGDDKANTLSNQANPDGCLPVWHTVLTRDTPDEIHTHIYFNEGIYDLSSPDAVVFIPVRLRFRIKGTSTWNNGPEFHVAGKLATHYKMDVAFLWQAAPSPILAPPASKGVIRAFTTVPDQAVAPLQSGWQAHSWFAGSTSKYLDVNNYGTSDVANIGISPSALTLYLDEGTFPKGRYEIQFMCGSGVLNSNFAPSTYSTSSRVLNLFGYWSDSGTFRPAEAQDKGRKCSIQRAQSIWNTHPIAKEGLALIALKAKNQSINSLSVVASGYVQDWDGSGWNSWVTTSNPAPHFRDVLSGSQNLDPLPDDVRDDAGILAWRTECASKGYTCDAVVEGGRIQDTLNLLASCGYARPYQSEVWGVVMDKDRTGETPVQVFSRRNSTNFRWERAFARAPNAFRVTIKDSSIDYEDSEFFVYRPGYTPGSDIRIEDVSYDGIVAEDRATVRAKFDLQQAIDRSTFYYLDAPAEYLVCRKGDLVGINHDVIMRHCGDGRILALTVSGGNITHIDLDSEIEVLGDPDMLTIPDMLKVDDMLTAGLQTGIAIRRTDGTVSTHAIANGPGYWSRIELSTPIAVATTSILTPAGYRTFNMIEEGALVIAGVLGSEYKRCLVSNIEMGKDMTATLTLVDEAPNLVRTP